MGVDTRDRRPRFNLTLPSSIAGDQQRWAEFGSLVDLAADIEAAGFDAVGVTEHPLPSSPWLDAGGHQAFDPIVALSFLAAGSTSLRLLTQVLVLPYHRPAIVAKALATLDVLSGGRLILGAAVGYLEAEFEGVGVDHRQRGRLFEASVEQVRSIWEDRVDGFHAFPQPLQRPGPPLWIGGNGPAARRRAVELGDGWMPFAQGATMSSITGSERLETIEDLARSIEEIGAQRIALGRRAIDVCFGVSHRSPLMQPKATEAEVVDEIAALADVGVTFVSVASGARDPSEFQRELERWAGIIERQRAA